MTAQVDASHPSGFVHMRKWAFEKFPALAHQAPAARAANPAAVSIYGVACLRIVLPVAWPAIGLRDVAAHPYRFERHQRLMLCGILCPPPTLWAPRCQLRPFRPA